MKSQSTLFIALGTFILLAITAGLYFFLHLPEASKILPTPLRTLFTGAPRTDLTLPGNETPPQIPKDTLEIAIQGGTLLVNDFTKIPGIATTTNSSFIVWFPGSASTTPPLEVAYEIYYLPFDQSFTVVLLQEPIAESRRSATADLMEKLGISSTEVCTLNAEVNVLYFVNEFYSAKNLGFPGCPGATRFQDD